MIFSAFFEKLNIPRLAIPSSSFRPPGAGARGCHRGPPPAPPARPENRAGPERSQPAQGQGPPEATEAPAPAEAREAPKLAKRNPTPSSPPSGSGTLGWHTAEKQLRRSRDPAGRARQDPEHKCTHTPGHTWARAHTRAQPSPVQPGPSQGRGLRLTPCIKVVQ